MTQRDWTVKVRQMRLPSAVTSSALSSLPKGSGRTAHSVGQAEEYLTVREVLALASTDADGVL